MCPEQFRVVIIGAGAISRQAHVPAVMASPLARLVGIVDPDVDRAAAVARSYGVDASVSTNIEQLDASFDGAIVATPNDLHASIAMSLIAARVPVLIEKPVATDVGAAHELANMARAGNVIVAVGYHTRHSGACRLLKYAIESEHFGTAIRFAHQDGGRGGWSPMSGYNLDTARAGGGVLVTTGTHFLDRLIWLWGRPDKVKFENNSTGGPESHCIAHFEFYCENREVLGSAIFSKVTSLPENTVVETTDGLLIMPSDSTETLLFRPGSDPNLEYEVSFPGQQHDPRSLYQRQLEDFVISCQSGRQPCVNAEMATQSLELVQRLYSASEPLSTTNLMAGSFSEASSGG